MDFNSLGFMFLGLGWKLFALAQGLQDGHILDFKFDGATTLSVKVFGIVGDRLDCYMQVCSSGSSSPSSTDGSGSSSSFSGSGGDRDSSSSPSAHVKEEEGSD
ncbi:hypothetical protein D1007_53222 [Hordeum vulgare]|nr:hypothetical protein D1007_53222 [Hordeum vulgare]